MDIDGPKVPRFSLAHTCRFMKNRGSCEQQQIFFKWTSTFDMCSVSHVPHVVCALPTVYLVLCWNSPGQRQETGFQFWWRWIRLDNQYQLNQLIFGFRDDKEHSLSAEIKLGPVLTAKSLSKRKTTWGLQLLIAASNCACETHAAAVRFTYTYIIFILL